MGVAADGSQPCGHLAPALSPSSLEKASQDPATHSGSREVPGQGVPGRLSPAGVGWGLHGTRSPCARGKPCSTEGMGGAGCFLTGCLIKAIVHGKDTAQAVGEILVSAHFTKAKWGAGKARRLPELTASCAVPYHFPHANTFYSITLSWPDLPTALRPPPPFPSWLLSTISHLLVP